MDLWLEEFAKTAFQRSGDTAHDLKTPLNIAVLNLELLRMRVRKLSGETEEDARIVAYGKALELELRRMATIFDAYFIYTSPPANGERPGLVDVDPIFRHEAERFSAPLEGETESKVAAHEARMCDLAKMLFKGSRTFFANTPLKTLRSIVAGEYRLAIRGAAPAESSELGKVFKFYYTDPSGTPELSLATARLIAETYGGRLLGTEREGEVELELMLPLGER